MRAELPNMTGPPYSSRPFILGVITSRSGSEVGWCRLVPSSIFWPGEPLNDVCRLFVLVSGEPYGKGEKGENLGLGLSVSLCLSSSAIELFAPFYLAVFNDKSVVAALTVHWVTHLHCALKSNLRKFVLHLKFELGHCFFERQVYS